jgi:hypothetical protein
VEKIAHKIHLGKQSTTNSGPATPRRGARFPRWPLCRRALDIHTQLLGNFPGCRVLTQLRPTLKMHETMSLFQDLLIWPSVAGARSRRRTWPFISSLSLSCTIAGFWVMISREHSLGKSWCALWRSAPRGVITLYMWEWERKRGTRRREICTMMCVTSEN